MEILNGKLKFHLKQLPLSENNKAAALLITILIIAAITLVIALSVALRGIGEMQMEFGHGASDEARSYSEACIDEALLQLVRDADYSGGDLTLGKGNCNINIDKIGPNPVITATGRLHGFTKKIEVEFDLTNKKILSWQERGL